ncbi:RNA polymerase sigma factor [Paenibacillus sp. CAA11]|uniref:RNA polymerase sigma factor n=1 Tax=Paenibacillus sp. CAA11 TaxID=1532905 RepID=UPI000D3534D5|nr:RNA polymerase sigma factor [Paenibacillus sp. CAA11]AWB46009.1 RNA polymerase sigma factor [Paenibacillus sp. CAA11]
MITDDELIRRMAEGDQEAFEMLVTRYHGPLLSYAAQRLGDREKAKDIVQETFIRLLRHLRQQGGLEHVRPWLYRVILNLCRDYWRSAAFRAETMAGGELPEQADPSLSTEAELERWETAGELAASLEALPEPQGDIIRLRFFHDLKLQEIADLLVLPLSTVKSHLYGGLRKLKKIVQPHGPDAHPKVRERNGRKSLDKESEVKLHESFHR